MEDKNIFNILIKLIIALITLLILSNLMWWSYSMYFIKKVYDYDFDVNNENYNHNINEKGAN